jgi:hypothetical protein
LIAARSEGGAAKRSAGVRSAPVTRWVFNVAAAVALIFFCGVLTLWVRSYSYADHWALPLPGRYSSVDSGLGSIRLSHVTRAAHPANLSFMEPVETWGFAFSRDSVILRTGSYHYRYEPATSISAVGYAGAAGSWLCPIGFYR